MGAGAGPTGAHPTLVELITGPMWKGDYSHTHSTQGQFGLANSPLSLKTHVFELREETAVPGENPGRWERTGKLHTERPVDPEPRKILK